MHPHPPLPAHPSDRPPGRPLCRRAGRRAGLRAGEGGTSSVELVIAAPLLVTTIFVCLQFAVWAHAAQCAHAAATEAAEATRLRGATAATGHTRAQAVLRQVAAGVLPDAHITVTRTPAAVRVAITGHAERLVPLPGLRLPVAVQVTAPTERWISPGNP